MFFDLLRFEIRHQFKNILFWLCVIAAIFLSVKENKLFELPVISDQEAYNFINSGGGESNEYKILELWKYDYSKRLTDRIPKDQNPDNFPIKYGEIKASEINEIIKNTIGNNRFSQLFFKIYAASCVKYFSFFLLFIFPVVLSKDKTNNVNDVIHTQPIKKECYILGKFFGNIILYIGVAFLFFVSAGVYHMQKVVKVGLKFNLLDSIIPFICFVVPPLLFTAAFLLLFSILFKYSIISIPPYLFLIMIPNEMGMINYFIKTKNALTGSLDFHVGIPPIKLYYGLWSQCLLLIFTFAIIWFLCYIWNKNKMKKLN